MRKAPLLLAALLLVLVTQSQTLPDVSSIKLDNKEDFNANANDAALKVSVYLLSTPIAKDNSERVRAETYLMKWMQGSPDYSFTLDEDAAELAQTNDDLFVVFMAAMTKYVLENPAEANDVKKVKLNGMKTLIEYAKNPKNNVKPPGDLTRTI